jgi:hypothetical protein
MPIRRLGLVDGVVPPTELVMAWIDVPSLQVVRSEQVYAPVDDDGLVVDYPELARRLDRQG